MTDKKITDKEIIKALRCCSEPCAECNECPLYYTGGVYCYTFEIQKHALDLINRQKAEIEKLKIENEILSSNADNAFQEGLNECRELFKPDIKAEAYKEFAEKLQSLCKEIIANKWNEKVAPVSWSYAYDNFIDDINNLLKEMEDKTK